MGIPIKAGGQTPGVPMPNGLQQAVLVRVKDLGDRPNRFKPGSTTRQVVATFANAAGEEADKFYTPSFHEKSSLSKDLKAVYNGEIPAKIVEMESLVGMQCQVLVQQKKNDKGYTNAHVQAVLPPVANQNIVPAPRKVSTATPDDGDNPFV